MMKQLNIIAVDLTPVLPGGENGGAKIFVLQLLQYLAKMQPKTQFILLTQAASHKELALLDKPNVRRLLMVGSNVASQPQPRASNLIGRVIGRVSREVKRLSKKIIVTNSTLLRDMQVDLLYCPFTAPTYFEPGIPTVCTLYDLQYKTYPSFFTVEDVAHRDRVFIDACCKATLIAAISDYSRDSIISYSKFDPERICTIQIRIAQRIASDVKSNKAILAQLNLIRQRYLIYPANFWKHKNHEMLLTAFGMARQMGLAADIKLVCTGAPGPRQLWLKKAAESMRLSDCIIFPGFLPEAELGTLLTNSVAMVFPSLYEGFGMPVIEAMAVGVPVACSNTASLPEVASNAAIQFDPRIPSQIAEAIIILVQNEALRTQLIHVGLQRATEFSDTGRMATEYWALFQHALANVKHENLLAGFYADGWVGPSLNIHLAASTNTQTLDVEFLVPPWLPQPTLAFQITLDGKNQGETTVFDRGTCAVLSIPIALTGGNYQINITPTIIPAHTGLGEDHRELSAVLLRCCITGADGNYEQLFPDKVDA